MERAARAAAATLRVETIGNGQRVRVRFDDAVKGRPLTVDRLDALQVLLDQRPGRLAARCHPLLQIGNRRVLEVESRRRRRALASNRWSERRAGGKENRRQGDGRRGAPQTM